MSTPVKIEVQLDGTQEAATQLGTVGDQIARLPATAQQAASGMRGMRSELYEGTQAARLLGMEIGIQLPRSVSRFLAQSELLGAALSGIFEVSVFAAMGIALYDAAKKMGLFGESAKDAQKDNDELTKSVKEQTKQLDDYYDSLDKVIRARGLIGLSGSARGAKEVGYAQADVDKARLEVEGYQGIYNRLYTQAQQYTIRGGQRELTPAAQDALAKFDEANKNMTEAEQKYALAKENLKNITLELVEAEKKEAEERWKVIEKTTYDTAAMQARQQTVASQSTLNGLIGVPSTDISQATINAWNTSTANPINDQFNALDAYLKQRKDDVASLVKENENLAVSIDKRNKDYAGALTVELADLDALKAKYADNADAIAAIEQRKQLLIQQTNSEIARDSEEKFNKAASAIEGFFNRVFLTAKSFSDVFSQLWTQIANYAVNQIAKMVAAWWVGQKSMTQAVVTGGYGGGSGGGMSQGVGAVLSLATAAPAMSSMTGGAGGNPFMPGIAAAAGIDYSTLGSTGTGAVKGSSFLSSLKGPSGLSMMGAMGGLMAAKYGIASGSPLWGGLGGMAAGVGVAGALYSAGVSLNFLGLGIGPLGALVGLGVGLFLAARKRGQQKQQSASVHASFLDYLKDIVSQFEQHKTDYDTATSGLTSAYENAVSSLQGMGTPGRNTISEITSPYQQALEKMKSIQLAREGRSSTIAGLQVPEFASGSNGIIRTGSGGFIAGLHDNEAVLNPRAAAALGDSTIRALNSGNMSSAQSQIVVNITTPDAKGVQRFFLDHTAELSKAIRQAALDKGLPSPF